jgi:hypothetical protein
MSTPLHPVGRGPEFADSKPFVAHYGKGGVPWYLLLKYLGFLTFFTWYVLEYQLPDYLEQGPGQKSEQAAALPTSAPPAPAPK